MTAACNGNVHKKECETFVLDRLSAISNRLRRNATSYERKEAMEFLDDIKHIFNAPRFHEERPHDRKIEYLRNILSDLKMDSPLEQKNQTFLLNLLARFEKLHSPHLVTASA